MGIEAILSVNANMTTAVSRVHSVGGGLSEETIKKLLALGIDPSSVKSEAQAQTLIAQAEKAKEPKKVEQTQSPQQAQNSIVDKNQLFLDIKEMGKLLGIDTTVIKDLKDVVDKFDVAVKEFVNSASAQANKAVNPQFNNVQKSVRISTGVDVVAKPEQVQADFKSIKDRVEKLENEKKSMYSGQDMLGMLNRMALGI